MGYLAPALLAAVPAVAEPVAVPSGQPLELIEAFWDQSDPDASTLRLRLLAPEIGSRRDFAEVETDFLHVCRALGLPRVGPDVRNPLIIVSFANRAVPFGATAPEATQYFEAFRAREGDCVWEGL